MTDNNAEAFLGKEYAYGFVSPVDSDTAPKGLSEDTVRMISRKKQEPEFMLEWRLAAYREWLKMKEPDWSSVRYPKIDYQDIIYYSAPKQKKDGPQSLAEVDQEVLKTYEKLGIPLEEQKILAGVAVDAVFDSVSVATTYKAKLKEYGGNVSKLAEAVGLDRSSLYRKLKGYGIMAE